MFDVLLAAALAARVAVVTVTPGYRHESIPVAEEVIADIGRRGGWFVPEFFRSEDDLQRFDPAQFDVVMFVNTTGELPHGEALVQWVRGGGTFIGVHSAADTLHDFPEYLDMLGGEFDFHGEQTAAEVWVEDATHASTGALENPRTLFEEFYHFKRFDPSRVHLLLALRFDPDAHAPAVMPLAWWRDFGAGRVFYTALGHREDVWESGWFQQHLTGALAWAIARDAGPRRRAVRR